MPKIHRTSLALALLLLLAPSLTAQERQPVENFEEWLSTFHREQGIPSLSVAVLRDGEVILARGFGTMDDEGDLPTTAETSYFIASVTKAFTGVVFARLEADGLLDLDAPLATVPGWDDFCTWLRDSSIPFGGGTVGDVEIPEIRCGAELTLRHALTMRVNGEPGTTFIYNPLVFARLGRVLPVLTDWTFRELLHHYVLGPAGMDDTAAGWRDPGRGHVLTHLAPPFRIGDDGRRTKSPLPDDDIRTAAGLYSTVLDLARFDQALDANLLLSASAKQRMWTPPTDPNGAPMPYAYGWYVQPRQDTILYWHGGWQPDAYSALYLKIPDHGLTLIALANSEGLYWGNRVDRAEVDRSPVARKFLDLFVQ